MNDITFPIDMCYKWRLCLQEIQDYTNSRIRQLLHDRIS